MNVFVDQSPEVSAALSRGQPVVALETTVISHGLPSPQNLETARKIEEAVREQGAVPATIGLLDGRVKVGLSGEELKRFAEESQVVKVSRRDLAATLADGQTGATTVAATMFCASLVGIRFQATGGIGGVHRGGEVSLDVSADLVELARTPVAVICSGPKSVLDIGRTLEVLETLGVLVVGYRTLQCPAFYLSESGHQLGNQVDSPEEAARLAKTNWELGLTGGLVIANPVPEASAMEPAELEGYLQAALQKARADGVTGKKLTPYLLQAITGKSGQRCLQANIALLVENATLAAKIACCFVRSLCA